MTTPAKKRAEHARHVKATFTFDENEPLKACAGETSKANQALFDYAMMGAGRGLWKLIDKYKAQEVQWKKFQTSASTWPRDVPTPEPIPSKSWTVISEWSTKFHWQERVRRFDSMVREADLKAFEQDRITEVGKRKKLVKGYFNKTSGAVVGLRTQSLTPHEVNQAYLAAIETHRKEFPEEGGGLGDDGPVHSVTFILHDDKDAGNPSVTVNIPMGQESKRKAKDSEESPNG